MALTESDTKHIGFDDGGLANIPILYIDGTGIVYSHVIEHGSRCESFNRQLTHLLRLWLSRMTSADCTLASD